MASIELKNITSITYQGTNCVQAWFADTKNFTKVHFETEGLSQNTFRYNYDAGYWCSQNHDHSSYSWIRFHFTTLTANQTITITGRCQGEYNYDYGLISKLDTALSQSYTADSSSAYSYRFYGSSLNNWSIQTHSISVPTAGDHFIDFKFRKDSGSTKGRDRFEFRINELVYIGPVQVERPTSISVSSYFPNGNRHGYYFNPETQTWTTVNAASSTTMRIYFPYGESTTLATDVVSVDLNVTASGQYFSNWTYARGTNYLEVTGKSNDPSSNPIYAATISGTLRKSSKYTIKKVSLSTGTSGSYTYTLPNDCIEPIWLVATTTPSYGASTLSYNTYNRQITFTRAQNDSVTYLLSYWAVEEDPDALIFVSTQPFSIQLGYDSSEGTVSLSTSTDGITFSTWDLTTAASSGIKNGQHVLYMRGTSNTHISTNRSASGFTITGEDVRCYGDIKNLFRSSSSLDTYALAYLFYNCTALTRAPDIDLTAFTLSNYCCRAMFQGCTSLTTAPKLSVTALSSYCYYYMFRGCTALTTAPELPITTLQPYCYYNMFYGCTSLIEVPELPATTLTSHCYHNMFYNCSSLISVPELPATTLATYCYYRMFYGCTSLMSIAKLPAITLISNCYYQMFYGCSKIKLSTTQTDEYTQEYRIPTSGTGTNAANALSGMFSNTGGTFAGMPTIDTTYYVSNTNTII